MSFDFSKLDDLIDIDPEVDGGFTVSEFAEAKSLNMMTARRQIAKMCKDGTVEMIGRRKNAKVYDVV